MIVSEYRGLKVSELGAIRRELRKSNVTYHVVKNRLMKIAATEAGNDSVNALLTGPSAVAFIKGNEGASAKAVLDVLRPYRLVKVTGGVVGSTVMNAEGVTRRVHRRADVHRRRSLRRPASGCRGSGPGACGQGWGGSLAAGPRQRGPTENRH
jgi:large subunit ribosomal protein L10